MLVLKTGIYGEDCRSWNRHAIIKKTWSDIKDHFKFAYTSLRETQIATKDFTFHGANAAITNEYSEIINVLATISSNSMI